jgi:hypothetical protein
MTDIIAPEEAVQVMAQEFKVDTRCRLFVTVPGARTRLRPGASNDRIEVTVSVSGCKKGQAQTVLDRLRLTTRQVKDTVRVQTDVRQQELDARWWAWVRRNRATIHLDVRLPTSADADVRVPGGTIDASDIDGSLKLEVSGGSIHADGLQGSLDVRAYSSDVTVEWFDGSTLDLLVSSGSLTARRIDATAVSVRASAAPVTLDRVYGPVEVTANGAGATLREIHGRLTAEVQGGPLTLDGAPADGSKLVAYGSPLQVSLPGSLSADLRMEGAEVTLDDTFSFEGDREPRLVAGHLNDGGPSLSLRAVQGAIHCRPSD